MPADQDARLTESRTFAQFIQQIEEGRLHADLSAALRDIAAEMTDHANNYGDKAAGKLSLSLAFKLENGVFQIAGDFKVETPKPRRMKTIMWASAENYFSPHNPRQMQMFAPTPRVVDSGPGEVRTI